jgi:fructokinase
VTHAPSTLALADLDAGGGARYGFWREGTASASLAPDAALAALPDDVAALHVGTLGLVFEPTAAAVEAVVEHLAPGAVVMVDPNVRPAAITDETAYRDRLGRVLRRSAVVKVSDEDLAWLRPGETAEDAARGLLAAGPDVVLLTRGPRGALVVATDGERDVPAPPVTVVDTIGAGDAFSGGFLARWRPGADGLEAAAEAAAYGALVAGMTCERAGASPPTLAEVQRRLADGAG